MKKTPVLFIALFVLLCRAYGQVSPEALELVEQKPIAGNSVEEYEYAKLLVVYVYKFWTKDPEGMKPRTLRVLYPDGSQEMLECSETEAINKLAKDGYRVKNYNSTSHSDGYTMYIVDYLFERRKKG